jgi:hypothetical protein
MLSLEEDSPIEVEQERLRFDFSERREHGSTYSPTALVEAAYEMKNLPTGRCPTDGLPVCRQPFKSFSVRDYD